MLIGGLQKMTLLDFPGKVAATIFTVGCDFRCSFCHNPELVLGNPRPEIIAEKTLWKFLRSRKKLLEGVCLTGGEPTAQCDLVPFIKKLKEFGLAVKLDTNGMRPRVLKRLFTDKLLDYVAMDIKAPWRKYQKVTQTDLDVGAVKESVSLVLRSNVPHEFRATVLPSLHSCADLRAMARQVKGADRFYFQLFRSADKLVNPDFRGAAGFAKKDLAEVVRGIKSWFKIDCGIR